MRPPAFAAQMDSRLTAFTPVASSLGEWLAAAGVPAATRRDIILILDELFTNIVVHGYRSRPDGWVGLSAEVREATVELLLRDQAPRFDPTRAPLQLPDEPLDQRHVGGLGLYFVQRLADQLTYRRASAEDGTGVNELRITKYFTHPSP